MGDPRQPSRRVGEWRRGSDLRSRRRARGSARDGRAVQAGLAAEAHDHLRRVGRRRAGPARLHRMGGSARRRAARSTRSHTSTATPTAAAISASRARTRSRSSSTVSRRTSTIPKRTSARGSAISSRRFVAARPKRGAKRASVRTSASARSARAPTYTPFLQHLGIASLNLGYGGEDDGGIYHSIYDDFYWYTHFSDTAFVYGRALAQAAGQAVMRLAERRCPALRIHAISRRRRSATSKELQQLRDTRAEEITERNREIEDGVFAATSDPRAPIARAAGRGAGAAARVRAAAQRDRFADARRAALERRTRNGSTGRCDAGGTRECVDAQGRSTSG